MYKQISSCHTQHGGAPSCDTAPFRHLPSTNCMLNNVKNNSYPWTKYSLCFILSSVSLSLSSFNLPLTLYLSSSSSLSLSHTPSPPQLHPHSIKIASVGVVIFLNIISSPTFKKSIIKGLLSAWGLPSQSTACAVQLCGKLEVLWMSVSLTRCAVSPFSRYFLSKLWFWCIQHALLIMQYSISVVSIIKIEMPSDICCIPAINVV